MLSACGGGGGPNGLASKPAGKIVSAAETAVSQARSVHISGSVLTGGQRAGIDMTLFKSGAAQGTLSISGSSADVVITPKDVYFKGPAAFWRSLGAAGGSSLNGTVAARLAGKWVTLPTSAGSGFTSFSYTGLLHSLKTGGAGATKVGTKTLEGQPVVGVKSAKQGVLWVSTSGTAYPVEITKSASAASEHITFSAWNAGTPPTAPAGAKSVQTIIAG